MNPGSIISAEDLILGDLDSVRQNWRWVLASGLAFVVLGATALGYSVLVTLASVFVLGWALVFGGIFADERGHEVRAVAIAELDGLLSVSDERQGNLG